MDAKSRQFTLHVAVIWYLNLALKFIGWLSDTPPTRIVDGKIDACRLAQSHWPGEIQVRKGNNCARIVDKGGKQKQKMASGTFPSLHMRKKSQKT